MTECATRAVCTLALCPATGRLLVRFPWAVVFSSQWPAVHASWRQTFVDCPGPRLAYFRPTTQVWSVRASAREQVEAWCREWGMEVEE